MEWILILTLFTKSHELGYGPIKLSAVPTKQICERMLADIKSRNKNTEAVYSCVRGNQIWNQEYNQWTQ